MEKVIIIGSGPAAHTAGIYAGRAKLNPLMYEGFMAGGIPAGGQLTTTTEVENFPGFPQGISGPELMDKMREQSVLSGTRIKTETVDRVDLSSKPFRVFVADQVIETETLILATGATAKTMDVPGSKKFWQKGISACAVCDGALPLFKNQHLVVVGGGDSACEETMYLTKYASTVSMLVRKSMLRASKTMQDRVLKNNKIKILFDTVLVEAGGEKFLDFVCIQNTKTGENKEIKAKGLFYAIGHKPNTEFLDNQLDLDNTSYILTKQNSTQTSVEGVFACGDVQDKIYRQAITAAGTGCMAALEVERFLSH